VTQDQNTAPRWLLIAIASLSLVVAAGIVAWIVNARAFNHWLAIHTGTVNESGPYYGFWSGFGSDIAEFGILGAIGTGLYQLVKKYNCHEPRCWRVGTHSAAGGQFLLCYRHHPDFGGAKPTHDLIARIHREHEDRQIAIHDRLRDIHQRLGPLATATGTGVAPADARPPATNDTQ
jgi:hypothetical protein